MKPIVANIRDIFDQLTSGDHPVWALAGLGLLLLLLGLKVVKGIVRIAFVVLALAALVGAGWWFLRHHGRI